MSDKPPPIKFRCAQSSPNEDYVTFEADGPPLENGKFAGVTITEEADDFIDHHVVGHVVLTRSDVEDLHEWTGRMLVWMDE